MMSAEDALAPARVFPGRPEHCGEVRRWVRAQASAGGADSDAAELAAGELFANAVRHTRSGAAGGMVTVAVTAAGDELIVHVHDLGADGDRVPCTALALVPSGDGRGLPTGGRGLRIVAAVSAGWGSTPAAWCPAGGADDPAAAAGGCCTWCRLPATGASHDVEGSRQHACI